MLIFSLIICIAASFLLGSVPCGYIIGRIYGVDVRRLGSGNIGATNVHRVLGKRPGILTLIADIVKGVVSVFVPALPFIAHPLQAASFDPSAFCGFAAIAGHCFSPFMNFQGGKGVAASLGVFMALAPIPTLTAVLAFALVLWFTRYVSAGSIAAAVVLPFAILFWGADSFAPFAFIAALLTSALSIWRHRANISRLIQGSENRFGCAKGEAKEETNHSCHAPG